MVRLASQWRPRPLPPLGALPRRLAPDRGRALVVTEPKRSARLDLRLPPEKLERWREFAASQNRTLTSIIEELVDEAISVSRTIRHNDAALARRMERLGRLTPPQIRRLEARGGDLADWPELDDRGQA